VNEPARQNGQVASPTIAGARLARIGEIAEQLGAGDLASETQAEQRRLEAARFFVACVGQFKRGKSTLINALVGQSILPVGVVPVTSVVTILRYGERPAALVHFGDGHTESVAVEHVAAFIDARRNPANERGAAVVEIVLSSSILRDGLCLVDTPGLGSVCAANTAATYVFVPRIDVALIVVGPDPPISGAELDLVKDVRREAGQLLVLLNKADQVAPEQRAEVLEFTRTTLERSLQGPVGQIFEISALERVQRQRPTYDWAALESRLKQFSDSARQRLVDTAGIRAVTRLGRRLIHELDLEIDALRKPLVETERRVTSLHSALRELDRSLLDLRFLFDAAEADLAKAFEQHRIRFVDEYGPGLQQRLAAWLAEQHDSRWNALRSAAMDRARQLVSEAVDGWLVAVEPEADALYQKAMGRFLRVANEHMHRVAADAGSVDGDEAPSEAGFHTRRQFYFTSLMYTSAGSPVSWLIDRLAPRTVRREHIARASANYLAHLLETNSHRVENDFRDRTKESRRWLEGQIRTRLAGALRSAERALSVAVETQHMSEVHVRQRLDRVSARRDELVTLMSFAH
jgi:GTP-binding protein EngB required for normal cell division